MIGNCFLNMLELIKFKLLAVKVNFVIMSSASPEKRKEKEGIEDLQVLKYKK